MDSESEDELCFDSYSETKRPYKKGKSQNRGDGHYSPWYSLIGKLEKREAAKECVIDYNVTQFCNIKKKYKKNGGRCG